MLTSLVVLVLFYFSRDVKNEDEDARRHAPASSRVSLRVAVDASFSIEQEA
jgi:hypothetical protein